MSPILANTHDRILAVSKRIHIRVPGGYLITEATTNTGVPKRNPVVSRRQLVQAASSSAADWAWDTGLHRVTFTLAGGKSATTGTLATATGLNRKGKSVTLKSSAPAFQCQVFPASTPDSKTYSV